MVKPRHSDNSKATRPSANKATQPSKNKAPSNQQNSATRPSANNTPQPPKIYGYARVSSVGQSLEAQLDQLRDCDEVFQEKRSGASMGAALGSSASTQARPELNRLLAVLTPGDTVKVAKMDRLARSVADFCAIFESIQAKGAHLVVLNLGMDTSTSTGKFTLNILASVAEFERELLHERQAEGIAKAKARGVEFGRPGLPDDVKWLIHKKRQNGLPVKAIARQCEVAVPTVYKVLREPCPR